MQRAVYVCDSLDIVHQVMIAEVPQIGSKVIIYDQKRGQVFTLVVESVLYNHSGQDIQGIQNGTVMIGVR